ncbi:mitochondrial import receptor subunit TOM6 homolog [Rhinoderma darwinii]|uniref:mitochondrial import receptor subunit TOM6 homolog n=1 Tax=Rhinoderma darwinii TaxID=43563 RepID=UPI003F673044
MGQGLSCLTSNCCGVTGSPGQMQLHPDSVTFPDTMAPSSVEKGLGGRGWIGSTYRFMIDRNDFRRNLLVNLGLFVAGVWAARNMFDIDLMAPQPGM